MHYVGLDWSLNSPAITVTDDNLNTSFFFFRKTLKKTKLSELSNPYNGFPRPDYIGLERIVFNAKWAVKVLERIPGPFTIAIEGLAFAAPGRVIDLAENSGAVKFALVEAGFEVHSVVPTVLKKFATSKGNADKEQMYAAAERLFIERKIPLPLKELGGSSKDSPISDIIDSFWLAEYARKMIANSD